MDPLKPKRKPRKAIEGGEWGAGLQDPAWSAGGVSHCFCCSNLPPSFLLLRSLTPSNLTQENLVSLTRKGLGGPGEIRAEPPTENLHVYLCGGGDYLSSAMFGIPPLCKRKPQEGSTIPRWPSLEERAFPVFKELLIC